MSSNKKSSKLKKGGAFEYAKMFQSSLSPCDKKEMVKHNSQNGGNSCAPNDDSYNTNYSTYYQNNPDTSIRLYNDYSQDWHYPNTLKQHIPYAINSSAGINEYQFGRTTPNNKFIVATGLVKNNVGIEMTGGKKKKKSKTKTTKKVDKSTSVKKNNKKCRIVKGNKETCCINPDKGYWCWSKDTSSKLVKSMKKKCCEKIKNPTLKSSVKKIIKKVKSSTTKKSKPSSSKKVVKKSKSSKPKSTTKKTKSIVNKTKNALKSVGKKVSSLFSKK
jgi:hypothetical protein